VTNNEANWISPSVKTYKPKLCVV